VPDAQHRQSALVHRGLAARAASGTGSGKAGIYLGERPSRGQLNLRGDATDAEFSEAVTTALGTALPTVPNTAAVGAGATALWLGPDEWLVVTEAARAAKMVAALEVAVAGRHAAVVDVSEGRAVIGLAGARAREVLMKGCSVDLHPAAFAPGACAQTRLARAAVLIYHTGDAQGGPAYDIYVGRSFADYLWRWLEDAAAEYGVAVTAGDG